MGTKNLIKKNVQRFDRFSLGSKIRKTPQGFLKIPASITRTGVLEYKRIDGSTWKELRLPEEVQRADSLATLAGAPITEDHRGMITPDNVMDYQVGFVSEKVSHDRRLVNADLIVQKRSTMDGVIKGELVEVSAGYGCDVEFSQGEWNGERYDAIQRNIVYNHVALGPSDWARGGSELKLHMDSKEEKDAGIALHLDAIEETGSDPDESKPKQKRGMHMKKVYIRLDKITYEVEVPEALAASFTEEVERMQAEAQQTKERLDSLQGELDAEKQSKVEIQKKLDAATDPATVEKAVIARVKLVEDCKKLNPEIDPAGKDERSLKIDALSKVGFEASRFDGKSDAYVDGVFESKLETAPAPTKGEPTASVGADPFPHKEQRQDAEKIDPYDSEAARQRMIERSQRAWEKTAN